MVTTAHVRDDGWRLPNRPKRMPALLEHAAVVRLLRSTFGRSYLMYTLYFYY